MSSNKLPPLVTIAIPSYNHGRYVQACIESIIEQDYENIELIIIDDGSTDDSVLRIGEMVARCRARFQRFEFLPRSNKGLCATLNEALEWARGFYFAVSDSDDVLLPSKTSVLLSHILRNPAIAGVFGGCEIINSDGIVMNVIRPTPTTYEFADILSRNKMIFSSCMLARTDLMRSAGGYLDGLYIEDWYMWLKLTENGACLMVIPTPLIQYRQHETNISKNALKMFQGRKEILDIFSNHHGVPMSISAICLEYSIELSRTAKIESFKYIVQALRNYPMFILKPFFWNALGRMLAPVFVLDKAAHFKNILQRQISLR